MDRITAIQRSLTAFTCGLIGLLPVIGLVPAAYAVWSSMQVRSKYGNEWNPAHRYLDWGTRFAVIGTVLTLFALAIVISIPSEIEKHDIHLFG